MVVQLVVVLGVALILLLLREAALYADHKRDQDRLREDREVAELEALFDLDWKWPNA